MACINTVVKRFQNVCVNAFYYSLKTLALSANQITPFESRASLVFHDIGFSILGLRSVPRIQMTKGVAAMSVYTTKECN